MRCAEGRRPHGADRSVCAVRQSARGLLVGRRRPRRNVLLPQLQAGTIKAFAVTAKQRLPSAPQVPTVDEAGLPDLYISVWHGLWAPKATPADVIATVYECLGTPPDLELQDRLSRPFTLAPWGSAIRELFA